MVGAGKLGSAKLPMAMTQILRFARLRYIVVEERYEQCAALSP
jgi:hypothetical protein